MARIISLAHYPYSDEALLQCFDALDWVLDDHYIDNEEHAAVEDLARTLGLLPTNVVYRREAGTAPSMPPCGRRAL